MFCARRVFVIDPDAKQDCILPISDTLNFIGSHSCGVKFRMQCHTVSPKGVGSWEDHESLTIPDAFIDKSIERIVGMYDVHVDSRGCVDGRSSSNVGYSDFNLVILPGSWSCGIAGKNYTNPWAVGALAGPVRNVICSLRNVERLQYGGRLRLTGRSKPVSGLAGGDGRSRLLLNRIGLRFGSIGASLNGAQLPSAIFGEISSRFGLTSAGISETFGSGSLSLPGDPQLVHRIGLRLTSLLQFIHSAGLSVASPYEAPGSGHKVLRILGSGPHLGQLAFHSNPLFVQFVIGPIGDERTSDGRYRSSDGGADRDPFAYIKLLPKWLTVGVWFVIAWLFGMAAAIWGLRCVINSRPCARLNGATRAAIGIAFVFVSVLSVCHAVSIILK